jgi:hypothetical protein
LAGPDIGTLYVLANRDNSLAKIGLTRNGTPDIRADNYAREHGIQWHVYWSVRACNVSEAEASAHRELAEFRFAMVPGAREIFHVTPAKAQLVAERYVVSPETKEQIARERAKSDRLMRQMRRVEAARVERQIARDKKRDFIRQIESQRIEQAETKRRRANAVVWAVVLIPLLFLICRSCVLGHG